MATAAKAMGHESADRVVLLTGPGDRPDWVPGGMDGPFVDEVDARTDDDTLAARLDGVSAVVIDAAVGAPLSAARRVHRLAPAAQLVIVASPDEHQDLNRSMLFTPGIGEVWLVEPARATAELFERATSVGIKRRHHARRSGDVAQRVAGLEPPTQRPRILADQYLAVLVELLPEPVLALGDGDELLFRNPAAAEVLRLARDERIDGSELRVRLSPAEPDALDALLEGARHEVTRAELRLGEGEDARMYDAVAAPVPGERPVRAVVLHDVTEQARARDQLQEQAVELEQQRDILQSQNEELQSQAEELEFQADELGNRSEENRRLAAERAEVIAERDRVLEELREAIRHRSRFYASMSHELRTPINAIIGYNELLRSGIYGDLGDGQREPLDRVDRAANHLLELVNDVLDLSKLEAGKVTLEPAVVDVEKLIDDLSATMGPLAEDKGVELRFEVEQECAGGFVTDPRRLRQILMNLLSNAIRYGAGAPVDVRCATRDDRLRVEVEDRGPGIAEDDLDAIFDEFVQVGEPKEGGTGLGLPIARTLARSLGGELTVRSTLGEGSVFELELSPMEDPGDEALEREFEP